MVHHTAPGQTKRAWYGWYGYPPHRRHPRRCRMTAGGASIVVHTLDEAAVILRVKPGWLRRRAAARKIPFTMLGGAYHFTAEHIVEIIRINEKRPAPARESKARRKARD